MRVVCLAGGVGGAKLADGLQQVLAPGELTVVVNTGDDFERHSLLICPDHDTVAYTLAGAADPVQGWGLAGETWQVMDAMARLGGETWFRIGDRDLATHLRRADLLRNGMRLTDACLELQRALGAPSQILPMADEPVRTGVRTDEGWLDFQDYFVRLHQAPEVFEIRFQGISGSSATPEVRSAIQAAEAIVVAPSNPVVSIGPILAVPGLMAEIRAARDRGIRVVGVSGIVGGKAVRGPADRMLASLGEESSALGVARRYASIGLLDAFVIDRADESMADEIRSLGLEVAVADTIMTDVPDRGRLAGEMLVLARPSGAVA
jgi:LPPG:FO 2-phospho-L-lactate transferase